MTLMNLRNPATKQPHFLGYTQVHHKTQDKLSKLTVTNQNASNYHQKKITVKVIVSRNVRLENKMK